MNTAAADSPVAPSEPRSAVARATKRAVDLLGALFALAILSPAFLVITILIKLGDSGPIFYRRRVVGLCGEFDAFKFRTMIVNADEVLHQDAELRAEFEKNFKLKADPRITAVGSVLRKYSLDELPQLFNVVAGQMSLVGPRMITAPELDKYATKQYLITSVKPGVTGYWQINGRQDVSYRERVEMDQYYFENWSLMLDLKILALTPYRVFKGTGAY